MEKLIVNILLIAFAVASNTLPVVAQTDTTLYQLNEVQVFGKPETVYATGSRVTTLDSKYLRTYASSTLSEALQANTPLYFKSYGISGISSVSFRGTNASQTSVLWNGLNISSPALGQTDFSTLPLSGIGEITVQHGSSASNYGSGSIGGAILLNSTTHKKDGLGVEALQEAGSFGRYFSSGQVQYNYKKLRIGASAYYRTAENNFSYSDKSSFGAPVRKQNHAAQHALGFTQDIAWLFSPATQLAFHAWYTSSDRELQPAMGSAHNNAQLQDENIRLMAALSHSSSWGKTELKAGFFNDYLLYSDVFIASVSDVDTYQLQADHTYAKGNSWSLQGGFNLQHFVAENDGYAALQKESRASLYTLFRYDPTYSLQLSFNLRQAFVQQYNPLPTPAFGFNWNFYTDNAHQFYLKGSTSGSYRVPSLNDRFWAGASNPTLQPEQGWSYESGLRHVFSFGNNASAETEVTAFRMLINDWIQWAPNSTGTWQPENLQKVRSQGMELTSKLTTTLSAIKFTSVVGYSYTASEQVENSFADGEIGKQLMYVPRHKATTSLTVAYKNWMLLGNLNYTGTRYTTNSETSNLNDFLLFNLALNKKIQLKKTAFTLSLRSDNVSNTEYQTMAFRAMPLRNYTLGIRFNIL